MQLNAIAKSSTFRRVMGAAVVALSCAGTLATTVPANAASTEQVGTTGTWNKYTLAFEDNFNGTALDTTKWTKYVGAPSGGNGDWDPANVVLGDGTMRLRTSRTADGRWISAGVSNAKSVKQQYGKWQIRVRLDKGYGIRNVALLWPTTGWPPEVDFLETSGRDPLKTKNTLASHYKDAFGVHRVWQQRVYSDYTQWHTIGVKYEPGLMQFTLDGVVVAKLTKNLPKSSMWLGMQTALGSAALGAAPNETTPRVVDMQVDWVKIYRYNAAG